MRPASSNSTFTPAIASWNAAIPPAAPLPTTITSQRSLPGLIESASRFDSSSARVKLTSRGGSSCIRVLSCRTDCPALSRRPQLIEGGRGFHASRAARLKGSRSLRMLLSAVRTVLAVFGLAADELFEELITLVAQLLADADLRRVV